MNRVKVYLGKRGSGKSTRLRKDLTQYRRVLIFNSLGEPTYEDFQQVHTFRELIEILKSNPAYFRIAYRGLKDETEIEVDFDFCARAVTACKDLHFAVEEIGLFSNSWKMPASLQTIVSAGRHNAISFYCTSQRASNVNPLIRALATEICTFIQTEPRDIDWLVEVMGDEAYKVKTLPQFQSMLWSDTTLSQRSDLDDREDNTVQLEQSPSTDAGEI